VLELGTGPFPWPSAKEVELGTGEDGTTGGLLSEGLVIGLFPLPPADEEEGEAEGGVDEVEGSLEDWLAALGLLHWLFVEDTDAVLEVGGDVDGSLVGLGLATVGVTLAAVVDEDDEELGTGTTAPVPVTGLFPGSLSNVPSTCSLTVGVMGQLLPAGL